MYSLKDSTKGDAPKFLLFANMLDEITRLLAEHGKDLTDIVAMVDRATNTKLNIDEALAGLDKLYYLTNNAVEYYKLCINLFEWGIDDNDNRLIMTDEIKTSYYSWDISVINPELLVVVSGGFIDFLKIHQSDQDGGHLIYILRYNDLGGMNEDQ